jgi:lysophospholipase L1-like esterase
MKIMHALALLAFLGTAALPCPAAEAVAPAASALPKVLVIGDSVSLGYTPTVVGALEGKAVVKHNVNPDNAGSTRGGLKHLDGWLGDTQWDVIHFNWGLWDINRRVNGKRDLEGPIALSPEEYEANLEKLVTRLEKTGAKLIWAPITCCPGGWGRRKGDDVAYNAVAEKVMKRHGVAINDLHKLSSEFPPDLYKSPGNVHFSEEGYRKLGEAVARAIAGALPSPRD